MIEVPTTASSSLGRRAVKLILGVLILGVLIPGGFVIMGLAVLRAHSGPEWSQSGPAWITSETPGEKIGEKMGETRGESSPPPFPNVVSAFAFGTTRRCTQRDIWWGKCPDMFSVGVCQHQALCLTWIDLESCFLR